MTNNTIPLIIASVLLLFTILIVVLSSGDNPYEDFHNKQELRQECIIMGYDDCYNANFTDVMNESKEDKENYN